MDREHTRAKTHIADDLRISVLAQEEGAELWLEGHLMRCPLCHEPVLCLWEQIPEGKETAAFGPRLSCPEARNSLFRYLEQGRWPGLAVLHHLLSCLTCSDHFLEPAKALYRLEIDEGAISALD